MARKGGRNKASEVQEQMRAAVERYLLDVEEFDEGKARLMSRAISHEVCRAIGGAGVYLPKDPEFELEQRDLKIWEAFDGQNTYALARQFDLSERQVQFIIKHVRRIEVERRQSRLPGFEVSA